MGEFVQVDDVVWTAGTSYSLLSAGPVQVVQQKPGDGTGKERMDGGQRDDQPSPGISDRVRQALEPVRRQQPGQMAGNGQLNGAGAAAEDHALASQSPEHRAAADVNASGDGAAQRFDGRLDVFLGDLSRAAEAVLRPVPQDWGNTADIALDGLRL
ncbi:hypothetical protein [Streptomyces sp. NEAU-NA10]|uniref:hypothetical protein n=1 Tax=Streptomyces sp. NEAU-NA10 TaxID=3416050 RepID=UPI003CC5600C